MIKYVADDALYACIFLIFLLMKIMKICLKYAIFFLLKIIKIHTQIMICLRHYIIEIRYHLCRYSRSHRCEIQRTFMNYYSHFVLDVKIYIYINYIIHIISLIVSLN